MGIFNNIASFLKREIELNKKYYENLEKENEPAPPQPEAEQLKLEIKKQPISQFDPHTQVRTDTATVYYAYGHVLEVFPPPPGSYYENRDIINAATFIVSDGVAYDLTDKKSIYSIKVPNYHIYAPHKVGEELGVTGYLEYVLRMHSGLCWNSGEYDIAIACLEKATQLMKYSTMGWPKKEFYRIVNHLHDLGKFKKAKEWEEWIDKNIPTIEEIVSENVSKSCEILDTDLVIVEDHCHMCCEMCAKYRKRVYSTAGKDFRFPRFPKNLHLECGLSIHPFVYGVNEPSSFTCKDIIAYSNRPFEDDRTPEEIKRHNEMMEKRENEARKEREAKLSKIIYCKLRAVLPPEDCPKSISGFSRMRNANSKNYQALVKKAEAAGFKFPETLEEVAQWPENQ